MTLMQGLGASKGIAMGHVFIKPETKGVVEKNTIQSVELELQRVDEAKARAITDLAALYEEAKASVGEEKALIFEVHQMMLDDEDFLGRIRALITEEKVNAEYAVKCTGEEYAEIFASLDDPYLQERSADIHDISQRLLAHLTGRLEQTFAQLTEPVVLVAKDLLPSDTMLIDKKLVLGIITQDGGQTSHSSILARALQIPAVVGVEGVLSVLEPDAEVILDGETGLVLMNPSEEEKTKWSSKQREFEARRESLRSLKGTKSITKDGVTVGVHANIGSLHDVEAILDNDAEGIGLFRSEFLYMQRESLPSEEEQFLVYKEVLKKMGGKPVTIRTLDVGGDKGISYLQIPPEENPFLGYRGIRVCLGQPQIFKTQLRALFRASVYGKLGIMFPMISTLGELQQAKALAEEIKDELRAQGIPFSEDVKLGVMIETPAAALISDVLAKEADFFSIGTNDLTQYTLAVDRMNSKVAQLYDTSNLAVLRLIQRTIEKGHNEGIRVGICGEAAADPSLAQTFVAMGIDELSVNAGSILEIRGVIQGMYSKDEKLKLK